MNQALQRLASEIGLFEQGHEHLRLAFGLACASRVRHLLEDPQVVACLSVLDQYVAGKVAWPALEEATTEVARLANRHRGSQSIDGSAHAAVSATYAVANALAGKPIEAASYAAYASVYAYGGYAVTDPESFQPEIAWQLETLRGLAAGGSANVRTVGGVHTSKIVRLAAIACVAAALSFLLPVGVAAQGNLDAPNVVPISPRLVTSGQPTAAALKQLSAQGFGAVIYLVPSSAPSAVPNERAIVEGQGMSFVNIPIIFNNPTEADFDSFVAAMAQLQDRKVLVHCEVNMRASSMVFLYRTIVGKESADGAYQSVAGIWSPRGPWRTLIDTQLHKHGIEFEPY